MPSLLITTSRRTSNRVRSFIRDLSTVFPNSERFNRGSLSQDEIFARIKQSDAKGLIIVTIFRGNPDLMMIYDYEGNLILDLKIESAILRREIVRQKSVRSNEAVYLCFTPESSKLATELITLLSSILNLDPIETSTIPLIDRGNNDFIVSIDIKGKDIIWTHYQASTGIEIGPRIRIRHLKSLEGVN